jgi:hypothetical protein
MDPVTGNGLTLTVPSGVVFGASPASFAFGSNGSASSQVAISVSSEITKTITIEMSSGYAH